MRYPMTPDDRYFVVRGRLWRCSNPTLDDETRKSLVAQLMAARRAVKTALQQGDEAALTTARQQVDVAKVALGERGEVWWTDDAPDYNRRLVKNTPYAEWYASLDS
ncbi:hypothetical protein H6F43_12880 [Leptolyngbya sp. FACHB-36]|uniref:hypothetical protein n=1 Tax=Leptolyngbya sp. FACHB-36 TaxID=2692808 RepID=UPI001680699E|nr:hypothetical protein [Leptolyngbya sp. FACHB-36]MBD2021074.1 hypothetical protein [Leptolyngbya sp. FACHB-36]